jgi:hypothetical protein
LRREKQCCIRAFGAVDLDKCYNWDTRAIAPWAQAIVDRAPKDTYCEITVSGTGLRLIGLANDPELHRKFKAADGGSFELYRDTARFITISGLAIQGAEGVNGQLTNIDALLDALAAEAAQAKQRTPQTGRALGGGETSVLRTTGQAGQLPSRATDSVTANDHASLPIAYQLYLPKEWADDAERRKKARVPEEIEFKTKPQIALDQLRAACAAGVPRGVVLGDSSYGSNSALRARYTDSSSPKGRRFPPQDLVAPLDSKCLPYPAVTGAAAPAATSRPQLDRDPPPQSGLRNRPSSAAAMSSMCAQFPAKFAQKYVTQ